MDDSIRSDMRQLAAAFARLDIAVGVEGVAQTLARMAHRLFGCVGVLLIDSRRRHVEFVPAVETWSSPVQGDALALYDGELALERGETRFVKGAASAPGRRPSALFIGVTTSSGYDTVAFVWERVAILDADAEAALSLLATAGSLSLKLERAFEEVRHGRERLNRYIDEPQHRLRNALAFVRSIVRRSMRSAASPAEFALHLEGRIGAISRTQATLNMMAGASADLLDLVLTEFAANAVREGQFQASGPPVRLRARAAEAFGLALHELTTNSLKFGSLAKPDAQTTVTWTVDSTACGARLRFQWLERGVPIARDAVRRRGFGQEIIAQTLPYELDAATRFELTEDGLVCVIDMPLNTRTSLSPEPEWRTAVRSINDDGLNKSAP